MNPERVVRGLVCVVCMWGVTLSGQPWSFFESGLGLHVAFAQDGGPPSDISSPFGLSATQQLTSNATDFPAISTAPGLTFQYDPQTQLFERSSESLGPVFVERARTLGQGKFELGVSYLYIDFDELNGENLDGFMATADSAPGVSTFVRFDKFSLTQHIIPFFGTYGITDRWDINFVMPLIVTSFEARVVGGASIAGVGTFEFPFAGKQEKAGPGDLVLRTKYRLFDYEGFALALGSGLRFPTGDQDNLQGKGDYILEPFFALSREYARIHLHVASGIEINFDDSDRSRIRYAGGVAFDLIKQLAFTVDVIGSSSLKTDRITGELGIAGGAPPGVPSSTSTTVKTDIVDVALGLKGSIGPFTGFVTFFLPVTDDGIRADFIPAAGLQYSF